MLLAFFANTVSTGSVLTIVSILSVGYGLRSAVRQRADWKSVADANAALLVQEKEKVAALTTQTDILTISLGEEKRKTNVQPVLELVGKIAGSVAAMALHVNDLGLSLKEHRGDLDEHRGDYSTVSQAMASSMQSLGVLLDDMRKEMVKHDEQALERHDAIMVELRRSPTSRTRRDDQV